MTQPKHLSWENFRATVLVPGEKRVHRITDSPRIDVFGDGATNRVGLVIEVGAEGLLPVSISRLAFLEVRLLTADGRHLLEVSTGKPSLHHEFYHLASATAERVLIHAQQPIEALSVELTAFAALLAERPLIGTEREIGLLGELLFLEQLVSRRGPAMLDAWIGPTAEPHDFRVDIHEFEVKATLSPRRIHTINGAEQLIPSTGCDLHLVSIVLGPPGSEGGFSLGSTAAKLASLFFSISRERGMRFETLLASCDFPMADASHYVRKFALRRPIAIVPVDATFPSITRPAIQQILGPLAVRVDSFRYEVIVEGLEHEQGTEPFDAVLRFGKGA